MRKLAATMNSESIGTFTLDGGQPTPFPVRADSTQAQELIRQGAAATNPRKHKVLVIDDEQAIADSLTLILNHAGYDARAAYSGWRAIGLLHDFQPDMLVTDVIMPGITGIQTAIHVCAMLPSCKVLLISGNEATASLLAEALRHNRKFEILAKPFHPTELLARLASAVGDA
ncbi:MAG TPA: response regulator [Terracidiphilus sp.]|nr:response regulator [Terracidiphilus sp.]